MKKGKFLQLLKTLNNKEVKAFTHYLNGNYGAQTQLLTVYQYILKYSNDYNSDKLKKATALDNYFLPNGISAIVLNNRLSDLNKYLEEFLLWKKMKREKNRIEIKKMQLEIFKERKLTDRFYREIKNAIKNFDQQNSSEKNLSLLHLHELNTYNSDGKQYNSNKLESAMEHLDLFYATFKLKYASEFLNRNNVLSEKNTIWLLDQIKDFAKKKEPNKSPYLNLYYQIVHLLQTEDWATFLILENQLYHFKFENDKERLILLTILVNFLLKAYRKGELDHVKKILTLYQFGINENIMIANGDFPPIPFKNIVDTACIIGEFEWAKVFIEQWSVYLPNTLKQDTYFHTKAIIAFAEKDYQQSIHYSQQVKIQNYIYSVAVRALIIRTHYELGNLTSAVYACDAYEKYLRLSKLANKNYIIAGLNFIKIMRLLIKKVPYSKISNILKKLEIVQSKAWLLDKLTT